MKVPANSLRLGELLEVAGIVDRASLKSALSQQTARNVQIGELLIGMGLIDEHELRSLLELQKMLREGRAAEVAAWLGRHFGTILLDSGMVTEAQLERALQTQQQEGGRLGEILVNHGALAPAARDGALGFQRALASSGTTDCFRLGRMLVDAAVIDEATLEAAVRRQAERGIKLGEALVESGAIDSGTLNKFLQRQRRVVAAAMAGLTLLGTGRPTVAQAGSSLEVKVQVQIMKHASIRAVRSPAAVTVTQADIERGYVDLAQPVEVDIRTNDPGGFLLGFSLSSPMLKGAQLMGAGLDVAVGPNGGSVALAKYASGVGAHTVQLRARLHLSEQAQPGVLSWPVAIYISPT